MTDPFKVLPRHPYLLTSTTNRKFKYIVTSKQRRKLPPLCYFHLYSMAFAVNTIDHYKRPKKQQTTFLQNIKNIFPKQEIFNVYSFSISKELHKSVRISHALSFSSFSSLSISISWNTFVFLIDSWPKFTVTQTFCFGE